MADRTRGPTPLAFWLEEALGSWILPVAALAAVALGGALYLAGVLSEGTAALVAAVVAPLSAALLMVRPALEPGRARGARALAVAAAGLTLAVSAFPAVRAIHPGDPLFHGDVGIEGEMIPVPAGVSGRIKILVSGKLREGGEPSVSFVLGGTERPIEGKLERTTGYARVGRLGRTRVQHDHTSDWYEGVLPEGATLRLERLSGRPASRLEVEAYRDLFSNGAHWVAALVVLLLSGVAEARLGARGNVAVLSGMALAFGLLVGFNATPASAVGPTIGGVVLGAMSGALAGGAAGWIARRLVPQAARREPGRGRAAA